MPDEYRYRHRVTFDETNLVGNVYFAHFVHWQGHCRELFLADHAPGVLGALAEGLALVTVDCAVEFFGEGRAFDEIELRMTLDRLAGNRITMRFDYWRTAPPPAELLAHGRQTVACLRRTGTGLEPAAIPDELRRALVVYAPAGVAV
jgi:enediyne biosynthesis thioesterase